MADIKINHWVLVAGVVGVVMACLACLFLGAGAAVVFLRSESSRPSAPSSRPQPRPATAESQFETVASQTGSVNPGEILNVNFAGERSKKGSAAIGNDNDDFWNSYHFPFATKATLHDLKTAAGRPTGVSLQSHTLPGEWGFTNPDPMWSAFSYSETDKGYLRFPNLPAGRYDLYLFMHSAGDPDPGQHWQSFGRAQVQASGKDYGVLATEPSKDFLSTDWREGVHYVVFKGLELRSGGKLNITLLRGGNNAKPSINGLQLRRAQ